MGFLMGGLLTTKATHGTSKMLKGMYVMVQFLFNMFFLFTFKKLIEYPLELITLIVNIVKKHGGL